MWPGGVAVTQVTVAHGLGRVPTKVWAMGQADQYTIRWVAGSTDESQFTVEVRSWDNTVRPAGTQLSFSWLVEA